MNKRKYNITEEVKSFGTTYKVEMWDEYGNYSCVYERTVELATERIYDWWEETKEREESKKIRNKAIRECIEIDRNSGITSRNRDCLD
tara:strand:- start:84 stop:347 length:264 start_codon:yes stop_codon:yes gene_type:complete